MNILLIDKNPETVFILSRSLGKRGFDVTHCETFENAASFVEGKDISLIILDPFMAEEGKKFVAEHHKEHPEIPMIMLTDSDTPEAVEMTLDFDIKYYCIKPFDLRDFIQKVQHIVSKDRSPSTGE